MSSQTPQESHLYYILPGEIFDSQELSWEEKALYMLLSGYAYKNGTCFASNAHLAKRMGYKETTIKAQIKKLEDLGYISRETHSCSQNPFRKIRTIFVNVDFKKSLRRSPERPIDESVERPPVVYQGDLIVSKEIHLVSEEYNVAPPHTPSYEEESRQIDQNALDLAQDLLNHVKAVRPKLKDPKINQWARTLSLMVSRDKRSWDEIKEVIRYVFEDDAFWVNVIQSAEGLRKNFDKIMAKMKPAENKGTIRDKNIEYAKKVKRHLVSVDRGSQIILQKNCVINQNNGDSIAYDLAFEQFKQIILKWSQLTED